MSSVKEINEIVQDIVSEATKYIERMNVMYAIRDLMAKNEMLGDYFEQTDYDTTKLAEMKSDVAILYIRLEYILSEFNERYKHDYIKRNKIKTYYSKIVKLAKSKELDTEDRNRAFTFMRDIAPAYLHLSSIKLDDITDERLKELIDFTEEKECSM